MNILLVDGNGKGRSNLSSRLRTQNIDVEIATGGFHTLYILEQEDNPTEIYNVILLVEDSEDMGAHEIAGHIHSFLKKAPPIIYIHKKDLPKKEKEYIKKSGVDTTFFLTEKNFNQLLKTIDKFDK